MLMSEAVLHDAGEDAFVKQSKVNVAPDFATSVFYLVESSIHFSA